MTATSAAATAPTTSTAARDGTATTGHGIDTCVPVELFVDAPCEATLPP